MDIKPLWTRRASTDESSDDTGLAGAVLLNDSMKALRKGAASSTSPVSYRSTEGVSHGLT
jgi:hypothetical protein